MKICILSEFSVSNYMEGTNRITFEIAKKLMQHRHKVVILSPNWSGEVNREHLIEGIQVFLFNAPFVYNPIFRVFFYLLNALKLHHRHKFDVFLGLYTLPPSVAALLAGIIARKEKVPAIWEPATCEKASSFPFISFLFNRASGILTMTDSVKELISKNFEVPENLITSIPGFYDGDLFYPGEKDASLVDEYSLGGKFVILFVGRISTLKGVPYLIEAVKELKDIKVLLVGREVEDESFRTLVEHYGVDDSVIFLGYRDYRELPRFYRTCDCFVLPSLSEGFGLVVAEAMACSKPVIVSDTIPLPEVVGDAGIVVPANNSKELADAIIKLRDDKSLREYLAERALKRSKKFQKEKVMEKYLQFLTGGFGKG
jgi:glycosyltransferase involved in cell wall biosynthesis